jgi:hypothetical protein
MSKKIYKCYKKKQGNSVAEGISNLHLNLPISTTTMVLTLGYYYLLTSGSI